MEIDEETPSGKKDTPDQSVESENEENFKKKIRLVANDLKSDSSNIVHRALHYIRTKVIDKPTGVSYLFECGGTKPMYKILTTGNIEVLNAALSTLGNICAALISNEGFCDEMIKFEVSIKLASLLRKSTDKKILRRICRLIGNMAQSHALGRDLHKVNISIAINNLLNTTDCHEVKTLALRAVRWLWGTDKSQLVRVEAVKTVASLLDVQDPQLFKLVVRTLIVFTQPCYPMVAQQISGHEGYGYSLIVSKISEPSVNVLIFNLSHSPEARVELCKAKAVQEIIGKLNGGKIDSYLITALCVMCREPMARASLRKTPEGFKTLLSLLNNPKTKHFYPELLIAITQFNYDTPSLMMMVKGGLITVLVEKLDEYSKIHGEPHFESMPQMAPPLSPSSPSSSRGSMSPPPYCVASDPAMYSPRCSTPESDSPSTPVSKSSWFNEGNMDMDSCILEVLSQLTYQGTPHPSLATKTTITTFLKYIVGLRYPQSRFNFIKATKALSSILKCKNYFSIILEEETIIEIEKYLCRALHNDCWECRRLEETGRSILSAVRDAAQSGLGQGEIAYRLTTAAEIVKTNMSLIVPHVIEQPYLLNSFLFSHHALQILIEALHKRTDDAVAALHVLFTTLGVIQTQNSIQLCENCDVSAMRKESNISFQLDDGSIVHANKESLSHGCPMFEAMFRGGFIESQQATVQITDISAECLTYLARVIDEYCDCVLPKDHKILMEMVTASDRFLLPNLTTKILSVVMNSALSYSTSADIFEWGTTTGQHLSVAEDVSSHVIRYVFTAEMSAANRVLAVKGILSGKSGEEFCLQAVDIVRHFLDIYAKHYKSIDHKKYLIT